MFADFILRVSISPHGIWFAMIVTNLITGQWIFPTSPATGIRGKNIPPCCSGIGLDMAKEGGSGNVESQA